LDKQCCSLFLLFHFQEAAISSLGSDHQQAKQEIISLKEQLASTSQVSLCLDLRGEFNPSVKRLGSDA